MPQWPPGRRRLRLRGLSLSGVYRLPSASRWRRHGVPLVWEGVQLRFEKYGLRGRPVAWRRWVATCPVHACCSVTRDVGPLTVKNLGTSGPLGFVGAWLATASFFPDAASHGQHRPSPAGAKAYIDREWGQRRVRFRRLSCRAGPPATDAMASFFLRPALRRHSSEASSAPLRQAGGRHVPLRPVLGLTTCTNCSSSGNRAIIGARV